MMRMLGFRKSVTFFTVNSPFEMFSFIIIQRARFFVNSFLTGREKRTEKRDEPAETEEA